jgi:hypothetical protein
MAAESAYLAINAQLMKTFDGKRPEAGPADDAEARFALRLDRARQWDAKLRTVADYGVLEWTVAAAARQGSLYDTLHVALHDLKDPALADFVAGELQRVDRLLVERYLRAIDLAGRDPRARARADKAKQRLAALEPEIGAENLARYTKEREGR